jgi:hypothetical protein
MHPSNPCARSCPFFVKPSLLSNPNVWHAAVSVEEVLGKLVLAFPGGDHAVQFRGRRLRPSCHRQDTTTKQNDGTMSH